MKRPYLAVLVLLGLGCLILAGCSGDSPSNSPFTGRWAGQFRDAALDESGAMRLTVGPDGGVTGDFTNVTAGLSGTIKGTIDLSGRFAGSYATPSLPAPVALAGALTKGSNQHITGSLTQNGAEPLGIDLLARAVIGLGDGAGTVTRDDVVLKDGSYVHLVDFMPQADYTIRLSMQPAAEHGLNDPYLIIYDANGPSGSVLAQDDNSGGGKNAMLVFQFAEGHKYVIGFNANGANKFGDYVYQMQALSSPVAVVAAAPKRGGPKSVR